jgi:hypothetical protein
VSKQQWAKLEIFSIWDTAAAIHPELKIRRNHVFRNAFSAAARELRPTLNSAASTLPQKANSWSPKQTAAVEPFSVPAAKPQPIERIRELKVLNR